MNMTRNAISVALAIAGMSFLSGCSATGNATQKTVSAHSGYEVKAVEHGKASWYSIRTNYGTKTASGQKLTNHGATAAHKTLPMGTKVKVTNLNNGKSEVVTINDRGPYTKGRIIDLTIGAAERLGFHKQGLAPVKVEVLRKKSESPGSED